MATFHGSLAKTTLNGQEIGIGSFAMTTAHKDDSQEVIGNPLRGMIGQTVTLTGKVTVSPDFWAILVGLQLPYRARELHRNLARYCTWPYTN